MRAWARAQARCPPRLRRAVGSVTAARVTAHRRLDTVLLGSGGQRAPPSCPPAEFLLQAPRRGPGWGAQWRPRTHAQKDACERLEETPRCHGGRDRGPRWGQGPGRTQHPAWVMASRGGGRVRAAAGGRGRHLTSHLKGRFLFLQRTDFREKDRARVDRKSIRLLIAKSYSR